LLLFFYKVFTAGGSFPTTLPAIAPGDSCRGSRLFSQNKEVRTKNQQGCEGKKAVKAFFIPLGA